MMMDASYKPRTSLVLVLLFLGRGGHSVVNSQTQVECIVYSNPYVDCDWGSKDTPTANYSLYYWYTNDKEPKTECKHYLQRDGINVGCRITYIILYLDFNMYINASGNRNIPTTPVRLMDRVKPDPPFNLTLEEKSNNQLLLTWNIAHRPAHCLESAVKYKSNKDTDWMDQKTEEKAFSVPSVDPNKLYTFYVRSRLNDGCAKDGPWSEEAGPITWGKEATSPASFTIQYVLIPIGSVLLLFLLLLALICTERVWLVLMPAIPNPSKKFEDLFTAYKGNFSEWAGFSKDAMENFKPNYRESICRVSELFPGAGYLPVSNEAMGKAAGVSADPLLKVNIE
ncbi:cytokine receptor common subunit gamma [Elgaria multicarinata webbii]|uniref:cytokine receptor common subunit gamma n=1 Tax=Elgaria multicarinata webbii TaxID=159646 RepID=UPI002FCCBE2D